MKTQSAKQIRFGLDMRRGHHEVYFHDGNKVHQDGSEFWDLRIFKNQKDAQRFVIKMKRQGYKN